MGTLFRDRVVWLRKSCNALLKCVACQSCQSVCLCAPAVAPFQRFSSVAHVYFSAQ